MESNRFNPWRLRQVDNNGVQELRPGYPFVYAICRLVYTLLRLAGSASNRAAALIISNNDYRFILRQQVRHPWYCLCSFAKRLRIVIDQINKEINKPLVTKDYKGKLGLVSRTLSKVIDSNPRLLSKVSQPPFQTFRVSTQSLVSIQASTEAESDVLHLINLLADAVREFDETSTNHYEAGYPASPSRIVAVHASDGLL